MLSKLSRARMLALAGIVTSLACVAALRGAGVPTRAALAEGGGHEGEHATPPGGHEDIARTLGRLLADNEAFVASHDESYFAPFRSDQHPRVTVVACSDSRVHPSAFDRQPDGDLFVVRNIGNQVDNDQGSVAYGILHLRTSLLLVVGHVRCGAVRAAMEDYAREPPPIRHELDGLHLALRRVDWDRAKPSGGDPAEGAEARWLRGVLANVHQQVAFALDEYREQVAAGRLAIVGAVYDFRNDLGQGNGRLVIVDVNGVTDPQEIAKHPLVRNAGAPR